MVSAGALIGVLAFFGAPQDEKALQPALKKFQDDYYRLGAKEDDKLAAINTLAQYKHEKIAKFLAPFLTEGTLAIRIMTARALGSFNGVDAAPHELLRALTAQANSGKKQSAVRIEILRGLGALRVRSAGAEIAKLIEDKDDWVAKAAIDAAGRVRAIEAMDELIRNLRRIEGREGDGEISVNPLDDLIPEVGRNSLLRPDARQQKRPSEREFLRTPIVAALQGITRQNYASARDWDSWWTKNKATFKVTD